MDDSARVRNRKIAVSCHLASREKVSEVIRFGYVAICAYLLGGFVSTPSTDDLKSLVATIEVLLKWPRKVFQGVWQQADRSAWVVVCRGLQDSLSQLEMKAESDILKGDLDAYDGMVDDSAKTSQIDVLYLKLAAMRIELLRRIDKK